MAKRCTMKVKAYFADPNTTDGYGTVTGTIPCDRIEWNSDRPPMVFKPRPTDIYEMDLVICHNGACKETHVDLDVRGGTFRRRRK
jgi:hypothetical protein